MDLQEKVNKAGGLKKQGQYREALKLYDEVASALMQEAIEYAHAHGGVKDEGTTRKVMPQEFELVREHLRRDDTMAKVANNIATIFAEIGDHKKAEEHYEEAIAFIPENSDYKDPYLGLMTVREAQNKTTRGFIVATKDGKKSIEPFIKAILNPSLEEVEGLSELTTEEITEAVKSFSDEVILGLTMERPEHKGTYGFILNPRAFGIQTNKERLATIMHTLLSRFGEAQKNTGDWQKYVCQLRKTNE